MVRVCKVLSVRSAMLACRASLGWGSLTNLPKPRCFPGRRLEDAWKTWTPLAKFLGRHRSGKRILIIYYILYRIRVFQGILREVCMSSRRLPGVFQENTVVLISDTIWCAKTLQTLRQCAATCQAEHISDRRLSHAACGNVSYSGEPQK